MEEQIKRVARGRYVLIPLSDRSHLNGATMPSLLNRQAARARLTGAYATSALLIAERPLK